MHVCGAVPQSFSTSCWHCLHASDGIFVSCTPTYHINEQGGLRYAWLCVWMTLLPMVDMAYMGERNRWHCYLWWTWLTWENGETQTNDSTLLLTLLHANTPTHCSTQTLKLFCVPVNKYAPQNKSCKKTTRQTTQHAMVISGEGGKSPFLLHAKKQSW